jgi:hypothetical protein
MKNWKITGVILVSDGKKTCLGFVSLAIAMGLSILTLVMGGFGSLVKKLGGQFLGLDLRVGTILALSIFAFFFVIAIYFFVRVKDYSWLPAIVAGLYAIVPDLILGPEDDIGVLVLGGVISGVLAYRKAKEDVGVDKSAYRKLQ